MKNVQSYIMKPSPLRAHQALNHQPVKPYVHQRSKTPTHLHSSSKENHKYANNIYQPNNPLEHPPNYHSLTPSFSSQTNNRKHRSNSALNLPNKTTHSTYNPRQHIKYKFSYRTRQGVVANNPDKTNQDSLLIKTNPNLGLFGVADGHGQYGHLVSQFITNNMGKLMEKSLSIVKPHQAFHKVFNHLQITLTQSDIQAGCSGSTLVSVLIQDNQLTCANVGDSRAILARQIHHKNWEIIYLSQDHKPSLECQKRRIIKCGGRVHALRDQNGRSVGPLRVWLPNERLAMSRSLGDNVSKTVGVTHQPEIIQMKLEKTDKFIVIGSDGVWELISNQEVLQLLVGYYRENKLQQGCDALMKLAYERWRSQNENTIDDISFILIFLNQ